MELNFFGNGSGFSNEHNSAYFITEDNDLILIDCPATAFNKIKQMDLNNYNNIKVLITHTHGDHIGGLGLLIQYLYFVFNKRLTVLAPSDKVTSDIYTLLKIEGNDETWYDMNLTDNLQETWFKSTIPTTHSPQLEGKCFGYNLNLDNNVVYTGDTSTLKPFMPYLEDDTDLYVDTSVYYGQIHLKLEDSLETLLDLVDNGVRVHLMHLDDEEKAKIMVSEYPGIDVVKTIEMQDEIERK